MSMEDRINLHQLMELKAAHEASLLAHAQREGAAAKLLRERRREEEVRERESREIAAKARIAAAEAGDGGLVAHGLPQRRDGQPVRRVLEARHVEHEHLPRQQP